MLPKHALYQMSYTEKNLAPRERFELPLPDFVGRCSVQLSQRGKKYVRLRVPVPLNLCGRFPRGAHNQRRTSFFWMHRMDSSHRFLAYETSGDGRSPTLRLHELANWRTGVPYGFRSHLLDLKGR